MNSRNNLEQITPVRSRTQPTSRTLNSVNVKSQDEDNDITLGFLFGVWGQWWKWLVPMSLLLAVASSAIVFMTFKPKYQADARLEIAEQSPWVIYRDDTKAMRYVQTQIEMLRSPRVLNAAMGEPAVADMPELKKKPDPVKWLMEKGLEIEPVGESTFVSVSYKGPDADASANLVNTIIDKYFMIQNEQKSSRMLKILTILQANKKRQNQQVEFLQERVKKLGENLEVMPNLTGTGVVVNSNNPAQDLLKEVMQAELTLSDVQAEVIALQGSLQDQNLDIAPELVRAQIDQLPEIKSKRMEVQMQEATLAQIEGKAKGGRNSHQFISQEAKLQGMKAALDVMRASSYDMIESEVSAMDRLDRQRELDRKQTEEQHVLQLVKRLDERYRQKREEMSSEGNARLEFEFATQELLRARALFATISERESHISAELGAPPRPEIYRNATANYEPVLKYPYIELTASLAGSLLLPFAFAFLWENSVRRISSVQQLESKTNVGVIGEISRLPAKHGNQSKMIGQELGLFEESIDSLRTSLLLSEEGQDIQVLAVCSAVSGEGKTSVASQLAVSIARATGQPVLLIDGDMRAPDVHQIFETSLSPGLCDVLDEETPLEEAINRSWSEHVHLLPAGELKKSPHKLLGTPAFSKLLDEARLWYRYIVIDTPPVLAASESLVVAKAADGTIVCAMRDFSRETHVRLAHSRLVATGAETIGTVLNGVPVRSYSSRYGSYGHYGYADTKS